MRSFSYALLRGMSSMHFWGKGKSMQKVKFWSITILSILVLFGLIGFGWLRSSLPKLDGEVTLAGLKGPVTIARDAHGIPHIGAANDHDLYFALGFVHGQDRLWQMEMNRRIGHGRISEVVGDAGLPIDKYFRTLGFTERATSAFEHLDAETKTALESYAAGVNAFLENRRGALPPEFLLTGITPAPWSPIDTLVWQKLMWLDLSGNSRMELARARLLTKLSPTQVAAFYPDYPGDTFAPLPEQKRPRKRCGFSGAIAHQRVMVLTIG